MTWCWTFYQYAVIFIVPTKNGCFVFAMKDNILENVLSIWLSVCVTKENGWKAQIGKVGRQGSRCSQCLKTCWLTKLCRLVSWSFQLNKKRLNELCINIMDFWRKDIRSTPFSFFFCLSIFSTMLLYLSLSSSSVRLSFFRFHPLL